MKSLTKANINKNISNAEYKVVITDEYGDKRNVAYGTKEDMDSIAKISINAVVVKNK